MSSREPQWRNGYPGPVFRQRIEPVGVACRVEISNRDFTFVDQISNSPIWRGTSAPSKSRREPGLRLRRQRSSWIVLRLTVAVVTAEGLPRGIRPMVLRHFPSDELLIQRHRSRAGRDALQSSYPPHPSANQAIDPWSSASSSRSCGGDAALAAAGGGPPSPRAQTARAAVPASEQGVAGGGCRRSPTWERKATRRGAS
jgi:hypothetical protein